MWFNYSQFFDYDEFWFNYNQFFGYDEFRWHNRLLLGLGRFRLHYRLFLGLDRLYIHNRLLQVILFYTNFLRVFYFCVNSIIFCRVISLIGRENFLHDMAAAKGDI